jgi:hypothetical protein
MRHKAPTHELTLPDGHSVNLNGFVGALEHGHLSFNGRLACERGLNLGVEALITSILVVPHQQDIVLDDLGVLEFWYNGKPHFSAPIAALMNRYHGFTKLAQMVSRMRLAIDPTLGLDDWLQHGTFAGALPMPIVMYERLMYEARHIPPSNIKSSVPIDYTIEIQALVKDEQRDLRGARVFHWKDET